MINSTKSPMSMNINEDNEVNGDINEDNEFPARYLGWGLPIIYK